MCMVWSQLAGIRTPPIVTTDFLYIRFIGDRTIQEKDFGKIQKDRVSEMKKWARFLKRAIEEHREINLAIVAANNHYAGFGPGTANTFRKMLDLSEVTWNEDDVQVPKTEGVLQSNTKQTSLSDFLRSDLGSIKLRSDALYLQTMRLSLHYENLRRVTHLQVTIIIMVTSSNSCGGNSDCSNIGSQIQGNRNSVSISKANRSTKIFRAFIFLI